MPYNFEKKKKTIPWSPVELRLDPGCDIYSMHDTWVQVSIGTSNLWYSSLNSDLFSLRIYSFFHISYLHQPLRLKSEACKTWWAFSFSLYCELSAVITCQFSELLCFSTVLVQTLQCCKDAFSLAGPWDTRSTTDPSFLMFLLWPL